jgi:hypothetical protein
VKAERCAPVAGKRKPLGEERFVQGNHDGHIRQNCGANLVQQPPPFALLPTETVDEQNIWSGLKGLTQPASGFSKPGWIKATPACSSAPVLEDLHPSPGPNILQEQGCAARGGARVTVLQETGDPHASRVELVNCLSQQGVWPLLSFVYDNTDTRLGQTTLPKQLG